LARCVSIAKIMNQKLGVALVRLGLLTGDGLVAMAAD
jgi:hypothetical protein